MEGHLLFVDHAKTIDQQGEPTDSLYEQVGISGQSHECRSDLLVDNTSLTEEEKKNTAVLFAVFPCRVVSIVAARAFWLSSQPDGTDKAKVFWASKSFSERCPRGGESCAVDAAELKAGFDRINVEGKPIIGAIVQNARALAAEPGRLPPKERTVRFLQQNDSRLLCTGGSGLAKFQGAKSISISTCPVCGQEKPW